MFKPSLKQRVIRKTQRLLPQIMLPLRRKLINNKDFTIIANNCWGGITYEYFGMQKLSPTVGMWFFADDYIKFISNLKHYVGLEIHIISPEESKYYEKLITMGSTSGLVGVLGDIEIVMLHFHDKEIAKEKWERRVERINWDNLIFKFSYMNDCTYELLAEFEKLDFTDISSNYKKIMFVPKPMPEFKSAIYIHGFENEPQITNDTFVFNQYFKLYSFINGKGLIQK